MLLKNATLKEIAAGRVDLAFRVWSRPSVKPGGKLKTNAGILAIESVRLVRRDAITEAEARRAGYASRAELIKELSRRQGDVYRVAIRLAGPDRRVALRSEVKIGKMEMKRLLAELHRLDEASRAAAWTEAVLRLVDKYPARRAPDLAASRGEDVMSFKRNVRKLTDLGLMESLEVGYRLSPRGRLVLEALNG